MNTRISTYVKIIDVTKPLEEAKVYYPTLQPPKIQFLKHYDRGDDHWVSSITMPLHSATHLDAPAHFYVNGRKIEQITPGELFGLAQVLDFSSETLISREHLAKKNIVAKILLFKAKDTPDSYAYFDLEAAEYLVQNGVKIIGTEAPSVDRFGDKTYPVHKFLSKKDILVIENLNLGVFKKAFIFSYSYHSLYLELRQLQGELF